LPPLAWSLLNVNAVAERRGFGKFFTVLLLCLSVSLPVFCFLGEAARLRPSAVVLRAVEGVADAGVISPRRSNALL